MTHVRCNGWRAPVLRAVPNNDQGRFSVVFLHGGAFCLMNAWTYHRLVGHIAQACEAQVISPDYSLAPEHPFPRALNECISAIAAAREEHPCRLIALVGDSAGGGLALPALLQMRDSGTTLPFGAVLLDLTLSSPPPSSPALCVQASENDLLRDDCARLRDACTAQDLESQYELFAYMLHGFQFFAGKMPEADQAIGKAAGFLNDVCDRVVNAQLGVT